MSPVRANPQVRPTFRRYIFDRNSVSIDILAFVDLGHDPAVVYPRGDDQALVVLPLEVVQVGDNPGQFGGLQEPGRVFRPLGVVAEGFEAPRRCPTGPGCGRGATPPRGPPAGRRWPRRGPGCRRRSIWSRGCRSSRQLVAPASRRCWCRVRTAHHLAGHACPTLLVPTKRWHRRLACAGPGVAGRRT